MQGNSPLVSIIVLSYNHAAFLTECLDSVLAQTYSNWELIIADDASKDNSLAIINTWINNNKIDVKTNFHSANTGIGIVLNECIDLCSGDFIKFIAADDILDPSLLAKAMDVFAKDNLELGIVFTNARYINEFSELKDKTSIAEGKKVPTGWVRDFLRDDNFIPAPSVIIRKEVYGKIGYYDPAIKTEDYDCWLRASRYFRFDYINEPLVLYRIHENNVSHTLDFANERIDLLIKNDTDGSFSARIKKAIMDQYYNNSLRLSTFFAYRNYRYKDKWLAFSIKNKLPYKIFRLVDKLLSTTK